MKQRKDGVWEDTLPMGNGKVKHFYSKSKTELKKKMADWLLKQDSSITMKDAIDEWLVVKEKQVSYNTYDGYKSSIKRINERFGGMTLSEIEAAEVQAFLNNLKDRGCGKKLVSRHMEIINMVYNFHIAKPGSNLKFNPVSACKMPSGLVSEPRQLADEKDIQIIKDHVDLSFGLFPYFLIYTGMRRGEALAIRYEDFDFENNLISVTKEVSWQTNQPVIKPPKTKSSIRKVPLLTPLKNALPKKWDGYLFSPDGGVSPLSCNMFATRWNMYRREAGLAEAEVITDGNSKRTVWHYHKLCPHQLRHEYATILLDADIKAIDAKEWLGHCSSIVTENTYQHIRESRRKMNFDKLEQYVNSQ